MTDPLARELLSVIALAMTSGTGVALGGGVGEAPPKSTQHWAVTVSRNGEDIVTIESNCLSGREITAEDEHAIRTAAYHLLAFIGEAV